MIFKVLIEALIFSIGEVFLFFGASFQAPATVWLVDVNII